MLTQEQINNLKPGDHVIVRGEFKSVDNDGDFWIKTNNCYRCYDPLSVSLPSEHGTSVPTPNYAPTRLFKKGDKAKRRTVDGRTDIDVESNVVLTVTSDEDYHGNVRVKEPYGRSIVTKSVFLELVTTVEELEPFYVDYITTYDDDDLDDNPCWCVKYRKCDDIVRVFYRNALEHPEKTGAAAEAECARLNEEWRKEQAND